MLPERIKQDDRNKICISFWHYYYFTYLFVYIPRPDLLSEGSKSWEEVRKELLERE